MSNATITVAYGDGIGPEIMEAVLFILKQAKAKIDIETIKVGETVYNKGFSSGLTPESLEIIKNNKILLKAPITTPQGEGYKSLNVTIRKLFGLYANIRPCQSLYPYVPTKHPNLNVVVVRENEEDLYAGIEHRLTQNVYQSLKIFSRPGCEKIIKFAFDYAEKNGRKKVSCLTKDNIMRVTDGLFHKVFREIAEDYPKIENEHYIVDIGMAKAAAKPELFDVIVTSNLYGDIVSDIIAEVCGSVGMAGSANIGDEYAMFEAIHGSAPKMPENTANPSGLLNAAIMMLVHIGQQEVASFIHNAWLKTIEDGVHTKDIFCEKLTKKLVGTKEFAQEVANRLGKEPKKLKSVHYETPKRLAKHKIKKTPEEKKELVGVDIFLGWKGSLEEIVEIATKLADRDLGFQMMSVRGLKVWPFTYDIRPVIDGADHWRLRFVSKSQNKITKHEEILYMLKQFNDAGIEFLKIENLYTFNGEIGFSLAQGE